MPRCAANLKPCYGRSLASTIAQPASHHAPPLPPPLTGVRSCMVQSARLMRYRRAQPGNAPASDTGQLPSLSQIHEKGPPRELFSCFS